MRLTSQLQVLAYVKTTMLHSTATWWEPQWTTQAWAFHHRRLSCLIKDCTISLRQASHLWLISLACQVTLSTRSNRSRLIKLTWRSNSWIKLLTIEALKSQDKSSTRKSKRSSSRMKSSQLTLSWTRIGLERLQNQMVTLHAKRVPQCYPTKVKLRKMP